MVVSQAAVMVHQLTREEASCRAIMHSPQVSRPHRPSVTATAVTDTVSQLLWATDTVSQLL